MVHVGQVMSGVGVSQPACGRIEDGIEEVTNISEGMSGYNALLTRASASPGESRLWATALIMPRVVAITKGMPACP
jgi:hypothetical protein